MKHVNYLISVVVPVVVVVVVLSLQNGGRFWFKCSAGGQNKSIMIMSHV